MKAFTNSRFFGIAVLLVVFCIFDAILLAIGFVPVGTPTILAFIALSYLIHSNSQYDIAKT